MTQSMHAGLLVIFVLLAYFSWGMAIAAPLIPRLSERLAGEANPGAAFDARESRAALTALTTYVIAPILSLSVGLFGSLSGSFIFEQIKGRDPGSISPEWYSNLGRHPTWIILMGVMLVTTFIGGIVIVRSETRRPEAHLISYEQIFVEARGVREGAGSTTKEALARRLKDLDRKRANRSWRRVGIELTQIGSLPHSKYSNSRGFEIESSDLRTRGAALRVFRRSLEGRVGVCAIAAHLIFMLIVTLLFDLRFTSLVLFISCSAILMVWISCIRGTSRIVLLQIARRYAIRRAAVRAVHSLP